MVPPHPQLPSVPALRKIIVIKVTIAAKPLILKIIINNFLISILIILTSTSIEFILYVIRL